MKNTFDLQIQSTASDGKHSPREIVEMARAEKLSVIALTDHDTVNGVSEALTAAGELVAPEGGEYRSGTPKRGICVIPGIEMSVEEKGAHILGYGLDYKNPELLVELEKFRQGRIEGAKKMAENLKSSGFVVEWEDVLREATGGVVARPHISRAVINRPENKEKLAGVSSVHDFIETYLFNASPNYVKRSHISAKDAIKLIHESSGVAVWSHPAIHFKPQEGSRGESAAQPTDYEALENFLKELLSWGIDGMEVFNPSHTEDDAEFVQALTVKYGILRTAGSDFHEKGISAKSPEGLHSAEHLGDYETYGFDTSDIITKLDEAIRKLRV